MTGKNTDFQQNITALGTASVQKLTLNSGGRVIDLHRPKVMGIINLTPDSFYQSAGRKNELPSNKQLLKEAEKHLLEGAYFLDLGGYSSRPGAEHVSEKEEAQRVLPAIKVLAKEFPEAIISVDTFRSEIAKKSVNEGAHLINDISAGQLDERMFETMANLATKAAVEGQKLSIHAPLIDMSKGQIVQAGLALGVDYSNTVSCYQASLEGQACGKCESCRLRRQGFEQAGIKDPTRYQKNA